MESDKEFDYPVNLEALMTVDKNSSVLTVNQIFNLEEQPLNAQLTISNSIRNLRDNDIIDILEQNQFDGMYAVVRHFGILSQSDQQAFIGYLNTNVRVFITNINTISEFKMNHWTCLKVYIFFLYWSWNKIFRVDKKITDILETGSKKSISYDKELDTWIKEIKATLSALEIVFCYRWKDKFKELDKQFLIHILKTANIYLFSTNNQRFKTLKMNVYEVIAKLIINCEFASDVVLYTFQTIHVEDTFPVIIENLCTYIKETHDNNDMIIEIIKLFLKKEPNVYSSQWEKSKGKDRFIISISKIMEVLVWMVPEIFCHYLASFEDYWICKVYKLRCALIDITCACLEYSFESESTDVITRQKMLDHLLERFMDENAFARCRCLQAWTRLAKNKTIPIGQLCEITKLTCLRLHDTSLNVKKSAIQLLRTLLEFNPFMDDLNMTRLQNTLHTNQKELENLQNQEITGQSNEDNIELIEKNTMIVVTLQTAVMFSKTISETINILKYLIPVQLKSHQYLKEALSYLLLCKKFNIEGTEEVLLVAFSLINESSENQDSILTAFKSLYITAEPLKTAKNLVKLTINVTLSNLECLKYILQALCETGEIPETVFKCLLLIALKKDIKVDNSSVFHDSINIINERVIGALLLISYCVPYILNFVNRSIDIFIKIGLIENANNGIIISHIFDILKAIGKENLPEKNANDVYAALIQIICDIKIPESTWFQACESAINAAFVLCPGPEDLFVDILESMALKLVNSRDEMIENDMVLDEEEQGLNIKKLTRFIFVLGHVAIQQMIYIEKLIKEGKKKIANEKEENIDVMREEMGLNMNNLETKLENIREKLEKELVDTNSLFGKYAPVISRYCSDIKKLESMPLSFVSTVTLTLSKFCTLDKIYCKGNINQILMMINESNLYLDVRKNLVVCLGDLILRFPNVLDPYTSNIFAILNSTEIELKKTCLLVLEHLTLNDMIKPRGNISKIAMLLIDSDMTIRSFAKNYISNLSNKLELNGNMLYNSIPDILSNLFVEENLNEEDFRNIMNKILEYKMTERQNMNITEKLCMRFDGEKCICVWRGLSYCLKKIKSDFNCLNVLISHIRNYKHSLVDDIVFANFKEILNIYTRKKNAHEQRELIHEYGVMLHEIRTDLSDDKNEDNKIESGELNSGEKNGMEIDRNLEDVEMKESTIENFSDDNLCPMKNTFNFTFTEEHEQFKNSLPNTIKSYDNDNIRQSPSIVTEACEIHEEMDID